MYMYNVIMKTYRCGPLYICTYLLVQEVSYEPAEHAQLTSTLAVHAPPEHAAVVGQAASNGQHRDTS